MFLKEECSGEKAENGMYGEGDYREIMRPVMDEKCSQHNCSRPMSQSVNLVDRSFSELTFNNLSFNELTHFQ